MDVNTESNDTLNNACSVGICIDTVFIYPAAILIISVLTLLEQRTGNSKCLSCCCRPRLVYPINLLDGDVDRLVCAASFGLTASNCIDFFRGSIIPSKSTISMQCSIIPTKCTISMQDIPSWAYTFYSLYYALLMGFKFYPFLLCLSTNWKVLGSILGFIYSGTTLANVLNQLIHCPMDDFLDSIEEKIFYFLPQILCLLFTTFTYLHTFVLRVIWLWKNRNKKQEHAENTRRKLAQPHQLERVKRLLKGKKLSADGEVNVPDVDNILKIYTYKRDPTFRYSSKIIVTFTVAIICIYQVAIAWIFLTKDVFHWGKQLIKISESSQVDIFMNLLDVAAASSAIGLSLSGIVTLVNATGIFLSYRADIKRLYRGDHSKFLVKREDISASSIVSRNLIYSGTQIAYMLWGFLILYIVFTIIGILLAVFLVLPITGKLDSFFLEPIKVIAPGIAISLILFYLQYQLCHRIFLQKIATESGDGKSNPVLAMDNRKAYHNVSYFLFFFYIFLGLFGCLMNRIGRTVLLGLAFLGRMDRCCLLPGYESFDNGYTSYISFLQLEEAHQHPVIVTFCDLLLDHVHQKSEDSMITYGAIRPNPPARLRTTNNSQRMWLKAYTILQNNLYNQKQENENNVDALSRVKETKETTNVVSENVDSEV